MAVKENFIEKTQTYKLTLGPCLFNWTVNDWRDFYFMIADETSIDEVYIGEVVCYKREPFFIPAIEEVVNKLNSCGKKVIFSSYYLMLGEREFNSAKYFIEKYPNNLFEVNDVASLELLNNKNHIIGMGVNVYNESTLKTLIKKGAVRVCLTGEIDRKSIKILAENNSGETEVQVFGRLPLAISTRCYHARIHGTGKNGCGYVCEQDYNGKSLKTLYNKNFLAINGTQTMSYSYVNLIAELQELIKMGVNVFRISPHHFTNMKEVILSFKMFLDDKISLNEAIIKIEKSVDKDVEFSNGFYYGNAGRTYKSLTVE